jgi:hypothetical protein
VAKYTLFNVNDLTNFLEHMEEDNPDASSTLPRWVFLEYAQMLNLAGPSSIVIFAHLSKSSCDALNDALHESGANKRQAKFEVHEKGVLELMCEREVDLKSVCLLDPKAHHGLAPQDGEGEFRWFLFGVIPSMVTSRNKHHLTFGYFQGILGIPFSLLSTFRGVAELIQVTTHREIEQGSCGSLISPIEDLGLCR